jgi:tripartite ATP-independent transporter DctP family solute receptor
MTVLFILLVGCSNGVSFGSGSNKSDVNEPINRPSAGVQVFRFADIWNDAHPSVLGDKEFARLVEKKSKGRLRIIVYPDGKLGDEKSVIDQVQLGGIDFARVNSAPLVTMSSKLGVLSVPYLFRDSEHMWKVLDGLLGEEFLSSLNAADITGLTYYDSGVRSFYSKNEFLTISNFIGQNIRVQQNDTYCDFVKAIGANPVQMAFGEVYDAMSQGRIDGAENNWSSYYSTNHYKIAKYYILDEHTRTPEVLIASSRILNSLSRDDKEIIMSSAKQSMFFQRDEWKKYENMAEEKVRASGVSVINLSEADKELLKVKTDPIYNVFLHKYKDIMEKIEGTK